VAATGSKKLYDKKIMHKYFLIK